MECLVEGAPLGILENKVEEEEKEVGRAAKCRRREWRTDAE